MTQDEVYAASIAVAQSTIGLHEIALHMNRSQLSAECLQNVMDAAIWRAMRQVFAERLDVALAEQMPDLWSRH